MVVCETSCLTKVFITNNDKHFAVSEFANILQIVNKSDHAVDMLFPIRVEGSLLNTMQRITISAQSQFSVPRVIDFRGSESKYGGDFVCNYILRLRKETADGSLAKQPYEYVTTDGYKRIGVSVNIPKHVVSIAENEYKELGMEEDLYDVTVLGTSCGITGQVILPANCDEDTTKKYRQQLVQECLNTLYARKQQVDTDYDEVITGLKEYV